MNLRRIFTAGVLALGVTTGGVLAGSPATTNAAGMKPSVQITSVTVSGMCITAKVKVNNFKLVKPVYKPPIPALKGNAGHIHYTLNGHILPTRDATTKQTHTFCGPSQFVKKGVDVLSVYLATAMHTQFPGTTAVTRRVMVK